MALLITKVRTAHALGWLNIFRVVAYRFGVWIGINPVHRLREQLPAGPFYRQTDNTCDLTPSDDWRIGANYFGWHNVTWSGECPDWMLNPFSGARVECSDKSWWQIPDFSPTVGDIKTVWEASRFHWVLAMAQRVGVGETADLGRLNSWLDNWCHSNPAYKGPNWKCGQEASIRVMHLAMAAYILGQHHTPLPALLDLVRAHLARVAPTLSYAIAQDNNHGTSEAAALFIGGSWINAVTGDKRGKKWLFLGRKWLEERVLRLIERDGSFSQYSVNYHRMVLDTLSMVEVWRRAMGLPSFSVGFTERARKAALWLRSFTDSDTGDVPNIGANDGARLIPLTDTDYRDYRPSVQLGCVLFVNARAYREAGSWDVPLNWLRLPIPDEVLPAESGRLFDQGGYVALRKQNARVYLRFPRFRFRPSQADALHLDLWCLGKNILCDAGSYSYNTDAFWLCYFSGTVAHNTIQFDHRDQMPRLGRFLFGDWLKTRDVTPLHDDENVTSITASYVKSEGAAHERRIELYTDKLVVQDSIAGFKENAVLRWRLMPGLWCLDGTTATNGNYSLSVTSSMQIERIELMSQWESRYYLQKSNLPVLEVEVYKAGTITTECRWQP